MSHRPDPIDYALLSLLGFLWGIQFALNKIAVDGYDPLTVGAGRLCFGVITLSLIVAFLPKRAKQKSAARTPDAPTGGTSAKPRQPWALYGVIAVVEAIMPSVLIPWGQERVDSAIAAILVATVPLFTLILAPLFIAGERLTAINVGSVLLGFCGILVLMGPAVQAGAEWSVAGEAAIVLAAIGWAVGLVLLKRVPALSPFLVMRNIFIVGTVPLVIAAAVIEQPWQQPFDVESAISIVILGIVCNGMAYGLFLYMIVRTGPTFTSLVGYLVTFFGVAIGVVILGDLFTLNDAIAAVLIVVALLLTRLRWPAKAQPR